MNKRQRKKAIKNKWGTLDYVECKNKTFTRSPFVDPFKLRDIVKSGGSYKGNGKTQSIPIPGGLDYVFIRAANEEDRRLTP